MAKRSPLILDDLSQWCRNRESLPHESTKFLVVTNYLIKSCDKKDQVYTYI